MASLLLVTGCAKEAKAQTLYVPVDCQNTEVLAAFPESIPNAVYMSTSWQPAEGTDLATFVNNAGVACSYGIQVAEIGATILWVENTDGLFEAAIKKFTAAGQKEIDLEGVNEEKAFYLEEGDKTGGEYHVWAVNLLVNGVWIQVNATFFNSIEDAMPIIKAAVDSLAVDELSVSKIIGCYVAQLRNDNYLIDITSQNGNEVSGTIVYLNYEKDQSRGIFTGSYKNRILSGIYDFSSEGMQSQLELFFLGDKNGFNAGFGDFDSKAGIVRIKRPLNLKWDYKYMYNPSDKCQTLLSK